MKYKVKLEKHDGDEVTLTTFFRPRTALERWLKGEGFFMKSCDTGVVHVFKAENVKDFSYEELENEGNEELPEDMK